MGVGLPQVHDRHPANHADSQGPGPVDSLAVLHRPAGTPDTAELHMSSNSFAGNGNLAKIGKTASRSSHLGHVLNPADGAPSLQSRLEAEGQ
jgi:hypothetical protein